MTGLSDTNPGPDPECPLCKGIGWVKHSVPVGHPDFGKLFPCDCLLPVLKRRQMERLVGVSGLGPALRGKTFTNFLKVHRTSNGRRPESNRAAMRAAHAFAENPQGWLVIGGGNGAGKTHLAAAIANHRARQALPVLFVVVPDLLDHLRATFNPQSAISFDKRFEEVRQAPFLVLDDLGTESATPWAREKLYQIFDYRYNAGLPTVITTATAIEELDPRLATRMLDVSRCRLFAILAPAYRGGQRRRKKRR